MGSRIKFSIITLGCKVNQYESEALEKALVNEGHICRDDKANRDNPTEADCASGVCIINTCAVTAKAAMQSRQAIRKAMREHPEARIVVTGCYAQAFPEEVASMKGVRRILGHGQKHTLANYISPLETPQKNTETSQTRICSEKFPLADLFQDMPATPMGKRTRPFLKIQDGCDAFCTYCIVPRARGQSRSMQERLVLEKIDQLHEAGYREIVLTGIHLGAYGKDLCPPTSLYELLLKIHDQGKIERLRLSSIEPNEISDEIIFLAARWQGFCPHFHIPLQSGDNDVLARMKRPYDREFFIERVKLIHKKLPEAAIGVDTLIGFPGESRKAFENTFELIETLPVTYLHVFPFSPRRGTPAWTFPDKVHPETIKKRCRKMRDLGMAKKHAFFQGFLGKAQDVLIEENRDPETGLLRGLSANYIPVLIQGEDCLKKQIMRAVIQKVDKNNRVFGSIMESG